MHKRGFTLIELLAVIVILAVIALIAVPLILSLVNKSRLKAAEESALFYVDTIENMLMINNIENTDGKTYKVKGKTVVDENNEVILNLEIKGDTPYNGVNNEVKISDGFVEIANLRFNAYYVHYEMDMETKEFKTCTSQKGFLDKCDGTGSVIPDEPKVESGATIEIVKDKTYLAEVYLDPTDISKKCTKEEAEANVNEFGTPTLIKEGCMKWYAYKDDGTNYTMILDHNTSGGVAWNSTNEIWTEKPPMKEVGEQLKVDSSTWEESIKNTARLISADEVAEITGANRDDTLKWNSKKQYVGVTAVNNIENEISEYYFDGNGNTYDGWRLKTQTPGSNKYAWLFDYTFNCTGSSTEFGCSYKDNQLYPGKGGQKIIEGYWTDTAVIVPNSIEGYKALTVRYRGNIINTIMESNQSFGIRPVITVSKNRFEKKEDKPGEEDSSISLQVGQYVQMVPSKTEYIITGDMTGCTGTAATNTECPAIQTINPSELTLWRVIRVNEDGTYDLVSNSISNEQIYLRGEIGSKKLIGTLNKIASQYTDNKYIVRTRAMGFDGQVEELAGFPSGLSNPIGEAYGKGDTLYVTDTDLVQSVYGSLASSRMIDSNVMRAYWLASRYHVNGKQTNDLTGNYFGGRIVLSSGDLGTLPIYAFDTSKSVEYAKGVYIRPIVTLSHKFAITGGNGTAKTPYVLKGSENS